MQQWITEKCSLLQWKCWYGLPSHCCRATQCFVLLSTYICPHVKCPNLATSGVCPQIFVKVFSIKSHESPCSRRRERSGMTKVTDDFRDLSRDAPDNRPKTSVFTDNFANVLKTNQPTGCHLSTWTQYFHQQTPSTSIECQFRNPRRGILTL